MNSKETIISPRLSFLRKELEAGNIAALEDFWQEIVTQGTPLFEPIGDNTANMLVTFLWRAADIENVVLFSYLFWQSDTFALKPLILMSETDLWYLSESVPGDARATYFFSPNHPFALQAGDKAVGLQLPQPQFKFDPLNPHRFVYPVDSDKPDAQDEIVSVVELPAVLKQVWNVIQHHRQRGQITQELLRSETLDNERRVWVSDSHGLS